MLERCLLRMFALTIAASLSVAAGCGPPPVSQTPSLPKLEGTTGPLEGYIYLVPTPSPAPTAEPTPASVRQQVRTYFILSPTENAALGEAASSGTSVTADSGEVTTISANGFFQFGALPVGLRSLTVSGEVGGVSVSDVFTSFIVIPETREIPTKTVEVRPNNLSKIEMGGTLSLTPFLLASGREVASYPKSDFTWSSALDKVATVDQTGVVTGVANGQVRIMANTGGVTGAAAVWVTGTRMVPVGELWMGSVTSYFDTDVGYNFRMATPVEDPTSATGQADFHMDDVGKIHAWGTGAANLGASAEFSAALQPPADGYKTEAIAAAAGEVVTVKMRQGGVAALRIVALEPAPTRRMDFEFIILSAR